MRSLLAAALGAAAAAFHGAAAGPHAETLLTIPQGTIAAFAQDGDLVSWFAPSTTSCNSVHVLSLTNGLQIELPAQGSARNVTCRWDVVGPVSLALAGTSVVWTLRERAPIPFDYLLGAGVVDRKERRFQEIAHTKRGSGLWLTGVSGDRSTLVFAVTSVDYVDEAGCLAGTATCALKESGGGIYRVVGRQLPKLVTGTGAAVTVAASAGAVAYVPVGS
ncbi:MAG: hypothetical protein QOF43_2041, partial [Gaiellaceae bacterium]|nr:hypothetical protein [Gaiellaceae bacterium]